MTTTTRSTIYDDIAAAGSGSYDVNSAELYDVNLDGNIEVRARGRPGKRLRRQVTAPLLLVVTPLEKRAELPIVELREAA